MLVDYNCNNKISILHKIYTLHIRSAQTHGYKKSLKQWTFTIPKVEKINQNSFKHYIKHLWNIYQLQDALSKKKKKLQDAIRKNGWS